MYFLRGFFGLTPVPNHWQGRAWRSGQNIRISLIVFSIPFLIFAAGAVFAHFLL